MKPLKEALISKDKRKWATTINNEYICVSLDPNYSSNSRIIKLINDKYVLNIGSFQMYVMRRSELISIAKKHNWINFTAIAPFKENLSREQIINLFKHTDDRHRFAQFRFITGEILKEINAKS